MLRLCFCFIVLTSMAACAPVGSDAWCKKMEDKPKGEWTGNDAADYAKHCIFNGD